MPNIFGQRTKKRKMKVSEAFEYLIAEEEQRLIDMDQVTKTALDRVEQSGIIFLDEIDKIAGRESGHGPDVSREGVQRDILPIVEGTTINTRYGMLRTDHILFIAAGAFHVSKPSDLIPELQGRFPIRVELKSLTVEDFVKILTEPKSSLTKQYVALLETEGLKLEFTTRRAGGDCDLRRQGERDDGKHRGAAAAHDHGAGAGQDQLRGSGAAKGTEDGGGRGRPGGSGDRRAGRYGSATGRRARDRAWGRESGGCRSGVRAGNGGIDREEPGLVAVHFCRFLARLWGPPLPPPVRETGL